jgi:lipoyl(octanoyl) transferase
MQTGRNMQPEWRVSGMPVDYAEALQAMQMRVEAISEGRAPELVWLLEHPPVYTAGRSAKTADLLQARFPVHETGRGGEHTYHGPGQRVAYVMLDLNARGRDLRRHVRQLEDWGIAALARLGITADRREADGDRRVGLWVARADGRDDKIAALGVRVSKWVTSHGIAINLNPDLSHYSGIVPCGITAHGVTSIAAFGNPATMADLDRALQESWAEIFG